VQCLGCGALIDRRRSRSGDASGKRDWWVEVANYLLVCHKGRGGAVGIDVTME